MRNLFFIVLYFTFANSFSQELKINDLLNGFKDKYEFTYRLKKQGFNLITQESRYTFLFSDDLKGFESIQIDSKSKSVQITYTVDTPLKFALLLNEISDLGFKKGQTINDYSLKSTPYINDKYTILTGTILLNTDNLSYKFYSNGIMYLFVISEN